MKDDGADDFTRRARRAFETLKTLGALISDLEENPRGASGQGGTEEIKRDQDIRKADADLVGILDELDAMQRTELGKRRSKVPKEQLDKRSETLASMRQELESCRERKTRAAGGFVRKRNVKRMEDSELFRSTGEAGMTNAAGYDTRLAGRGAQQITHDEQMQLEVIKQRDREFDQTVLRDIAKGLDVLQDYAERFGDELAEQDRLIDEIQENVDVQNEKIQNVNAHLKEVLHQVRSPGRFCTDILCVMLMLGMIGVLAQLSQSG